MIADCASEIYKARLMLLHIAYKAENGMDLRNENGIAKVFLANMVHQVVDTALQLHGKSYSAFSSKGVLQILRTNHIARTIDIHDQWMAWEQHFRIHLFRMLSMICRLRFEI